MPHRARPCAALAAARRPRLGWLVPTIYIIFLLLPIYWLVNMSFKTNQEITAAFTLFPRDFTLRNYAVIFTDPSWYSGYINSIIYVVLNTVISLGGGAAGRLRLLALPVPRRQAPVLLAAHQPHGAAGGVRPALLPALFVLRADRHPYRRGAGPLPVQRAAGRVDPRRLHERRAQGNRRDRLYRRLFVPALLRHASSCR